MRYRNINNGAEFESQSLISAPDWITVGAESFNEQAAGDPEPAPKTETKRPAAKKKGAKK